MGKITVIIPVYNVEIYLNRCINSVINQTFRDLEIILVDDGSLDGSRAICEKYATKDDRIKVFAKENGGLSSARNYGLDRASGDYIYLLDSDDFIHESTLEKLINAMEQYGVDIVSSKLMTVSEEIDSRLEKKDCDVRFLKSTNKEFYLQNISNHACGKLYKKILFEGIRYPENRNYEDIATTFKLYMKANDIAYTQEGLYFYRVLPTAITKTLSRKNIDDLILAYRDAKAALSNSNQLYNYYLLTILYTLYSRVLRMSANEEEYVKRVERLVYEEAAILFKETNIKSFKSDSTMYKKLVLLKRHMVRPVVFMADFFRRIKMEI